MFNDRLEIHNNTMVKIQHTWYTHYQARLQRGGGNRRLPPPPLIEKQKNHFFYYMGGLLAKYFSPCGGFFGTFLHLREPFSPCEGLSASLFSMWGPFCYVFLLMGALFTMCGPLCSLFSMWGAFFALMVGPFMGGRPWTLHYIIYTVMLKCIKIQIYKITVIILTHICAPIAVNMC